MRLTRTIGWVAAGVLAVADAVSVEQGACKLGRREYPENSVVCSGGLAQHCENGIWQSNEGERCDAPNGTYLTPLRPYHKKSDEPIPPYLLEKYPWLESR